MSDEYGVLQSLQILRDIASMPNVLYTNEMATCVNIQMLPLQTKHAQMQGR